MDETDDALLTSGDLEDFGRFYDRYARTLLGFFQRRTGDPEVAADLTAETFAAALVSRSRYRPSEAPAAAWLFAIAQHKLTDYRRRGRAEDRMRAKLGMEPVPLGAEDAEMIRWLGEEVATQLVDELPRTSATPSVRTSSRTRATRRSRAAGSSARRPCASGSVAVSAFYVIGLEATDEQRLHLAAARRTAARGRRGRALPRVAAPAPYASCDRSRSRSAVALLVATVVLIVPSERRDEVPAQDLQQALTYRVPPGDAAQTAQILRERLSAAGIAATVTADDDTLTIKAQDAARADVAALTAPGRLAIYDWERLRTRSRRPAGTDRPRGHRQPGRGTGRLAQEAEARTRAAKNPDGHAVQAERWWFALGGAPALTNADLASARAGKDPAGGATVAFELTPPGQRAFLDAHARARATRRRPVLGGDPLQTSQHLAFVLDDRLISVPFINWQRGARRDRRRRGRLHVRPRRSPHQARLTAALLSAGPLPTRAPTELRLTAGRSRGRPGPPASVQVEPVQVHDLDPGGDEVADELLARVVAGVDLGERAQLGVRAEDEVGAAAGPLQLAVAASRASKCSRRRGRRPRRAEVEQVDEEVVRQRARGRR